MLGWLRMSVEEWKIAYIELSSKVFRKKHVRSVTVPGKVRAGYSSKELQRAMEDVVEAQHLDRDAFLKDTSPQACKVFVCAISKNISLPYLLRSYPSICESPDLYNVAKIWEAGRATSAASSFFEPIAMGSLSQEFLDGGTGAILDTSTETQTTVTEFHRANLDLGDEGEYYRFNVARGLALIGLEEANEANRIED